MSLPVLEIENLSVSFMTRSAEVPAVMDFSMKVLEGDAMGLVGESGCGKSTVALAIMNYLGGMEKLLEVQSNIVAEICQVSLKKNSGY